MIIIYFILLALLHSIFVAFSEALRKSKNFSFQTNSTNNYSKIILKIKSKAENFSIMSDTIALVIVVYFGVWYLSLMVELIFTNQPSLNHSQLIFSSIFMFIASIVGFSLVGVILPKIFARKYYDKVIYYFALPMTILYYTTFPALFILYISNHFFNKNQESIDTSNQISDEIRSIMVERSVRGDELSFDEHELIENVFDFSDTPAHQIMVPRTNISAIDIEMSKSQIINYVIEEGYSRLPVYKDNIDNIIGEIYSKDILNMVINPNLIDISDILRVPFFVSEEDKISDILKLMQKEHHHLAIVLNEFGGVAGLLTIEDIIEELVGEIQDEYDEEKPLFEEKSINEFKVEATITISDLNEILPEPIDENSAYNTIGGYITHNIGRIPQPNETFKINNYKFNILESNDRKIITLSILYEPINDGSNKND